MTGLHTLGRRTIIIGSIALFGLVFLGGGNARAGEEHTCFPPPIAPSCRRESRAVTSSASASPLPCCRATRPFGHSSGR